MEPTRIGPYRLEDRIGAGGMGVVYRAFDERLERWVALKLISPDEDGDPRRRDRLRREAQASARLNHPAIVQIYDLVQTEEADGIVMELVAGERLDRLLRAGPLALERALPLACEIAEALAAAHACGIVHRDLKTENVVVTPAGRAKVLDFGIAKRLDREDLSLTEEGAVLGTFRTMAPEQAEGLEVDHRADLFSLGTLLYELFTGRSPFVGASAAATLRRICEHRQTPAREVNSDLPEALSNLIDHLLEKAPHLRPSTAGEIAVELASMAAAPAGQTRGEGSRTLLERVPSPPPRTAAGTPVSETGRTSGLLSRAAERRQVTALCCSLARPGGRPVDPEELIEKLPELHVLVAEVVRRFDGHFEARGPGCLACFGYPEAHEDDALRAVAAALEIAGRAGAISAGHGGEALAVRIGLHTGPMLVTKTEGERDDLALGGTPDEAAFVQTLAEPGGVLVSPATHRLVAGFFDCEELAPVVLPGAREPVRAYRVLAGRETGSSIEPAEELTPLVGREQELDLLLQRWALAREGRGQAVLLAGEAGIGKSRLVRELRRRVKADAVDWLEVHGSPFHRNSSFHPLRELLRRRLGGNGDSAAELRLARLEEILSRFGLPLAEAVPLFAGLLALPLPEDRYAPLVTTPEAQRRKLLETILSLLLAMAERQPMLLIGEDLHWFDPSSLELLGLLIENAATAPILLLLTFRPEFQPPWSHRGEMTRLNLPPLSRSQAALMVERLAAGRELAPVVREQIAARTDGLPLFVEELTKTVLDGGAAAWAEIPFTLEGSLRARLDRLGAAKEVAQIAAVLGREFSYELLHAVLPWSEEALQRELDRLVAAQILYRRGVAPRPPRYLFKHALLQAAVYGSLLRSDRQACHRRIAGVLEAEFAAVAASQPELPAHHWDEAGAKEEAIAWWKRAAQKAVEASAGLEAVGHLTRALELLGSLADSPERDSEEIALQLHLATALGISSTFSDQRVEQALARAWDLCGRIGTPPQLASVLTLLVDVYMSRGQPQKALESARQFLDLAQRGQDRELLLLAHQKTGFALLNRGDFPAARTHLETALTFRDAARTRFHNPIGFPAVSSLCVLSWTLWMLGFPEQAVERSREACDEARRLRFPFTIGHAEAFTGELYMLRGEPEPALERAESVLQLAKRQSLLLWEKTALFIKGWALAAKGRTEEGIAVMRQTLEEQRAGAMRGGLPRRLALLAGIYLEAGRIEEGLALIDEGLRFTAEGGQCYVDAELWRLRAELLARRAEPAHEVEDLFQRALEIARGQSALSLELRAAMGLSRFWAARGRRPPARELLAPVYGRFTEGFDSPDLREARALLAELG